MTTEQTNEEERERVARRAYEIYLERGGVAGLADDDWLQAESEILGQTQPSQAEVEPGTQAEA